MRLFFLFFILLPIIEIYFFVIIGSEIGAFMTIVYTFLTALSGGITLKYFGMSSFFTFRDRLHNRASMGLEMISAFLFFIGGFFLLIPGFFTDFLGLCLFFPFIRNLIIAKILSGANNYGETSRKNPSKHDYIDHDD